MYIRKNLLKEKIKSGQMVLGMEIWLRDPRVIELMGQAGFDFAHIEYEHVAHDWESLENLIRTAELSGLTPLFRSEQCVGDNPPVNQIIKALKCGAQIIMVPHVNTPECAQRIVEAAKFPPYGKRGIATCDRSAIEIVPNESKALDMQKFIQESNDETMLWAIIESPEAVENIEAILEVEGIDAVGFGHQDYSIKAGFSNDFGIEIEQARAKIRETAIKKGKQMWWNTDQVSVAKEQYEKGIQIFLMSVDIIHLDAFLRNMIKQLKTEESSE